MNVDRPRKEQPKNVPTRSKLEERILEELPDEIRYEPYYLEYYDNVNFGSCADCGSTAVEKQRWYLPDFELPNWRGSAPLVIEAKGKFTASDRRKHLRVREWWPDLEVRIIFGHDSWITKKKRARYSDWAEANGFKYIVWYPCKEWKEDGYNEKEELKQWISEHQTGK